MVPPKTHPKWAALAQGSFDYKFSNPAASMLLWSVRYATKQNPSPETLTGAIDDLHSFCTKYQNILKPDLAAIFK
jgi:hypothetical protein